MNVQAIRKVRIRKSITVQDAWYAYWPTLCCPRSPDLKRTGAWGVTPEHAYKQLLKLGDYHVGGH